MRQEKIWFVTGASSGFGLIWTEAALQRGDKVVATARDPKKIDNLVKTYGDSVLVLPLDVTKRDAVFGAVEQGHHHFGRLDVILCNAGYAYMSAIEEIELSEARANFETNVFGTLSVIQAALPLLRAQGSGHILTMSSIGGVASFPTAGIYGATKFALESLTESLAGEVAGFGIKTTIIEPGSFSTGFGAARKMAPTMDVYDDLRHAIRAGFKPETTGNPLATAEAILSLVDVEEPPLRLILGDWLLPILKDVYQERINTWENWAKVSNSAQGTQS
ncbi:SDR family NAD(P)-dependent oxidoreductase [Thalassospira marina]|uniref:Short-chain dehydrogenase/reductase n=1 Tax=Thalassospira marina TaxID=2048283 RepID=A0A2N3KMH9_9PROT|nr:SDR family NAD(P)-dependent oxidoreductase [Thalassospira marina]PKR51758.1 short-chain dehydrogenase/reductase [Thalassospira marina]